MKHEILKTEEAIGFVKETFTAHLTQELSLIKISAPIAVHDGTGINDDLNGIERTVQFDIKGIKDKKAVIVNSLAKWKRMRLHELSIPSGIGLLTDMRAIRPDEDFTPIHSIYVDQWDWEKTIESEQRTLTTLKEQVKRIYQALQKTEMDVAGKYPDIKTTLPPDIIFIHAEELLKKYPSLTVKERETEAAKEYGAIFIMGIGGKLSNGEIHDGRAPDYDDWSSQNDDGYFGLNGDIVIWNPVLQSAFEISSMGIRVDKAALLFQLEERGLTQRKDLYFHQLILNDVLPHSIGGGIGQSRVCMFMLRKKHIGEVQVSLWPDAIRKEYMQQGLALL